MDMERADFLKLVEKYNAGDASPEELKFLHTYYRLFEHSAIDPKLSNPENRERLRREMQAGIKATLINERRFKTNAWYLHPVTIAASVTIIFFAAFLFVRSSTPLSTQIAKHKEVVIMPGTDKATLTLADGSKIILEGAKNGVLAMQGNTAIRKTSNGKLIYLDNEGNDIRHANNGPLPMNTISTPRGGQFQLTLPDGSRVWLNSASSIRFPADFDGNARIVEITGEAYFEVAKVFKEITNKTLAPERLPFVVKTADQQIEVLGTHFNVNAYADESKTTTTLLEGRVKVSIGTNKISRVLAPGQQSFVSKNLLEIGVEEADIETAIAWKNGYFRFNKQDLKSIMRQISRWYDVDVAYSGELPSDLFVGKIKRSENIADVLRVLEISKVNFKFSGRKIIVR